MIDEGKRAELKDRADIRAGSTERVAGPHVSAGMTPRARSSIRVRRLREVDVPEAFNLRRDRVRWGPIVAGLFTALTALLLLSLTGLALGLSVTSTGPNALPPEAARTTAAWAGISAILAFAIGGYVAGHTAAVFDRGWGALNGALVFVVALPAVFLLAGLGVGSLLGPVGDYIMAFGLDPSQLQEAAQEGSDVNVPALGDLPINTVWTVLGGLVLALVASALGGALGTRRHVDLDDATAELGSARI